MMKHFSKKKYSDFAVYLLKILIILYTINIFSLNQPNIFLFILRLFIPTPSNDI